MDRNTEKIVFKILKGLQNEMAIILITHKIQTAKIADRIYIIENGKIQCSGTPSQLSAQDNYFSQLLMDAAL